jgi:hypothetical protein
MKLVLHQVILFLLFSYSLPRDVLSHDKKREGHGRLASWESVVFPLHRVECAWHVWCTVLEGASAENSTGPGPFGVMFMMYLDLCRAS